MPRESGSVTDAREARVPVKLAGGEVIECLVDTGFNGQLMIPREVIHRLHLPVIGHEDFETAGGHLLSADIALVEIEWLAERRVVEAIVSEGADALLGTRMLEGTQLIIDYMAHTATVTTQE